MKSILNAVMALLILPASFFAQVPNPGFELVDTSGILLNWRYKGLMAITLGDSIVYDGFLNSKSTDARTGQYALELRNSYNYTTGQQFMNGSVSATLIDTNTYIGFTDRLPLTTKPQALEFYYKFAQNLFNDSTVCEVFVYNSSDYEIGHGKAVVYGTVNTYQLKNVPMQYVLSVPQGSGNLLPSYATIDFNNKPSAGPAHIGQRTLIDDVSFKYSTVSIQTTDAEKGLRVYPNPSHSKLMVEANDLQFVKIIGLDGRIILECTESSIDVSYLENGLYRLQVQTKYGLFHTSLVVAH